MAMFDLFAKTKAFAETFQKIEFRVPRVASRLQYLTSLHHIIVSDCEKFPEILEKNFIGVK